MCNECIGGVMVSMLASSAVDRGLEPQTGQINDYEIGICQKKKTEVQHYFFSNK
jgi:hypothetical protein